MSTYESEIGDSLLTLAADVDHFTRNIVPQDRDAPARKCATEAREFAEDPSLEEAADVLITVLGWVTSWDHPIERLLDVAQIKMTTNMARTARAEAAPEVPSIVPPEAGKPWRDTIEVLDT